MNSGVAAVSANEPKEGNLKYFVASTWQVIEFFFEAPRLDMALRSTAREFENPHLFYDHRAQDPRLKLIGCWPRLTPIGAPDAN